MNVNFKTIFYEESIDSREEYKKAAEETLQRFPEAKVVKVKSHNRIKELYEMDPKQWIKAKKDYLVLGIKKDLTHQLNTKSSDYIAASSTTGCIASCQYCYVARNSGGSNVAKAYVNINEIIDSIDKHQKSLGKKTIPNQQDPSLWVYDIGCNNDNSLDALYTNNPIKVIEAFSKMENAKASLATKFVNEEAWLKVDPKGKTRIRYSLMPQEVSTFVDIRTSKISDRIKSMNNLVEAGYEVHANFSPVIVYGGDQWTKDWKKLWEEMNDTLTQKVKDQLKCEVIFLTHSQKLHDLNMEWNPKGEEFLVGQIYQHEKYNKPDVLVYNYEEKKKLVERFKNGINKYIPYCNIRYIF
jgi:spore photoproduct lyase